MPKRPSIVNVSKANAKKGPGRRPGSMDRLKMLARELSKKQGKYVPVKKGKK